MPQRKESDVLSAPMTNLTVVPLDKVSVLKVTLPVSGSVRSIGFVPRGVIPLMVFTAAGVTVSVCS